MTRVLVTGGAGFVGANLAIALASRHPDWHVVAFDNLHRRGSKLNLTRLEAGGVEFVRGDVRERATVLGLDEIDVLIECSAEPSAVAGMSGDTAYPFDTNLVGAYNCLELARRDHAYLIFLSTSRVYPYRALAALQLEETETRFELAAAQPVVGASAQGISEEFPMAGPRTIYGATKLAAELLISEYAANFGLDTVIDRCGVIAGPWQMGRVDQGVFTFWLLHHYFVKPLSYIGYGAGGKQVRDLIHVDDLIELIDAQLIDREGWSGFCGNVGGGREFSLSLAETTEICRRLTGNEFAIGPIAETRSGDVPLYLSDCTRLHRRTEWRPSRDPEQILTDIHGWLADNEAAVSDSLGL